MRKLVSMIFALALCLCLAIPAAAAISPQGGYNGGNPNAPQTGSSAIAVLALAACTAGGVGVAAYKKSKD